VLALALTGGSTRFLHLKIGLTGVGAWVLAVHQQWPLTRRGLYELLRIYGAVLVYHLLLS
jgi:hypothetical protein